MDILQKHNVLIKGQGTQPIIMLHGFGCNMGMWRFLIPEFEQQYKLIFFDHAGTSSTDLENYDAHRYSDLKNYADDIVKICEALELENVLFFGHSVSATMGILAYHQAPQYFQALVLIGPSPRYINEASTGYVGGFEREDIEELLEALESNYLGWSSATAPAIMDNPDTPELGQELTNSFCQMNPEVAENFAKATFYSDNRKDLAKVNIPTLIIQTKVDIIAPPVVGEYVHKNISNSQLVLLDAIGHLPHLSAPKKTLNAILPFIQKLTQPEKISEKAVKV